MDKYEKMSVEELLKLKAEIEALIEQKKKEKRVELNKKFKEMAGEAGLSIEDILSSVKERKTSKPAAVTYEKDGKVWNKRGRKPQWAKDLGDKLEDYKVNP